MRTDNLDQLRAQIERHHAPLSEAEYRHLIHVLEHLPESSADDPCPVTFGSSTYVSVDWLVGHIVRHDDHHLRQIHWLAGAGELPDPRLLDDPIRALP